MLQAFFSACARICVRELRKTETTDIIMVYSSTVHCLCATVACIAVPGSVVVLQHTWQVVTLLATGEQNFVGFKTLGFDHATLGFDL